MYSLVSAAFPEAASLPKLVVTYSAERACELVAFDETHYLVYDQYLGQTLSTLNRIFLNDGSDGFILIYACKYLAEKFRIAGDVNRACTLAYAYHENKKKGHLPLTNQTPDCGTFTLIQEAFVLSHELAHYVFNQDQQLRREVFGYAAQTAVEVLSFPNLSEKRIRDLIEEIACDKLATVAAVTMAVAHGLGLEVACRAIVIGLRHLRLLKTLDRYVLAHSTSDGKKAMSSPVEFMPEPMARVSANRRDLEKHVNAVDPKLWTDIVNSVMDESESYSELVDELVQLDLGHRLIKLFSEYKTPRALGIRDRKKALAAVDELTGWTE